MASLQGRNVRADQNHGAEVRENATRQWVLGAAGTLAAQDALTLNIFPTAQGLRVTCFEHRSNVSLDCSTFDASGNCTLLTRKETLQPMQGMRR